ncbi:hypothetical protein [Synechococcus sp. RSCCF101]|nr:hypothetical protein [Synechococcus sp. RSCCF101]
MGISRNRHTLIVYIDRQPFACCHDRGEALRVTSGLLGTHHPKRIAVLHA